MCVSWYFQNWAALLRRIIKYPLILANEMMTTTTMTTMMISLEKERKIRNIIILWNYTRSQKSTTSAQSSKRAPNMIISVSFFFLFVFVSIGSKKSFIGEWTATWPNPHAFILSLNDTKWNWSGNLHSVFNYAGIISTVLAVHIGNLVSAALIVRSHRSRSHKIWLRMCNYVSLCIHALCLVPLSICLFDCVC